jgi:putative flippase GtrA
VRSVGQTLVAEARSPRGQKLIKYTLTSVVAVFVGQAFLVLFYVGFDWSARNANLVAASMGAIPSFILNRYWAWGLRGRSHFVREVLPFWGLALLGLVFSTFAAAWAEDQFDGSAIAVNLASLSAFGVLWVAKFIIFNEILFKHRPEELPPSLDGRTGLPT